MTDLKSNIVKGMLAAACSLLAMAAGAASARQEARAQIADAVEQARVEASRLL